MRHAATPSVPTEPAPTGIPRQLRGRLGRRLFVVALGLFVGLGALGFYGVRVRTASSSGGGYELSVTYPSVTRPGLGTTWSVEVRRPGGFPDGMTLAVTSGYFDAFDEHGWRPAPASETTDGRRTILRFEPSDSEVLDVTFDARLEPGVQLTRARGRAEVLAGPAGPPVAAVSFSTTVMP